MSIRDNKFQYISGKVLETMADQTEPRSTLRRLFSSRKSSVCSSVSARRCDMELKLTSKSSRSSVPKEAIVEVEPEEVDNLVWTEERFTVRQLAEFAGCCFPVIVKIDGGPVEAWKHLGTGQLLQVLQEFTKAELLQFERSLGKSGFHSKENFQNSLRSSHLKSTYQGQTHTRDATNESKRSTNRPHDNCSVDVNKNDVLCLLANKIKQGWLEETVEIPETSGILFRLATGIKDGTEDEWKDYCGMFERVARQTVFPNTTISISSIDRSQGIFSQSRHTYEASSLCHHRTGTNEDSIRSFNHSSPHCRRKIDSIPSSPFRPSASSSPATIPIRRGQLGQVLETSFCNFEDDTEADYVNSQAFYRERELVKQQSCGGKVVLEKCFVSESSFFDFDDVDGDYVNSEVFYKERDAKFGRGAGKEVPQQTSIETQYSPNFGKNHFRKQDLHLAQHRREQFANKTGNRSTLISVDEGYATNEAKPSS